MKLRGTDCEEVKETDALRHARLRLLRQVLAESNKPSPYFAAPFTKPESA